METILKYPKIECAYCHCVFTFCKDDIKSDREKFIGMESYNKSLYERVYYVVCPICNSERIIKKENFYK